MKHCVPGWQSALVLQGVPAAPVPPAMHSLRGGAFIGGRQSTWQVCVAVQVVTPVAVLCGLTGSQPGSVPPSGASGAPPSTMLQFMPGASVTSAKAVPPFLICLVAVPRPIEQEALFSASTSKSMLPVSLRENPTDSVLSLLWLIVAPFAS